MEKTVREIAENIAPCGCICALCREDCKGCNFSEDSELPCNCYQRQCCRSKGIAGCWECADFPCDKGMFDETKHGLRTKAFVRCIKEDGCNAMAEYLLRNQERGILYHRDPKKYTGDYDGLASEEAILRRLRSGT